MEGDDDGYALLQREHCGTYFKATPFDNKDDEVLHVFCPSRGLCGPFDMWESEQITGNPRNSLYIRRIDMAKEMGFFIFLLEHYAAEKHTSADQVLKLKACPFYANVEREGINIYMGKDNRITR